jgi:flavin reductase (DIM6/NTAB) family NADH-FMN oxidoreductase RutF
MHIVSNPSILYFGTPVVLIGTQNEDGTHNLAPISSIFWLGYRSMIGISAYSKSAQNLLRTKQCTLNLPSVHEVGAVNRLALTTGTDPVPEAKKLRGYRFESRKFAAAGLTPIDADLVDAPLVAECPVQMEAKLMGIHSIAQDHEIQKGRLLSLELKIVRVHLEESILMDGNPHRVDPDKWRPLIMSFQQFYGLGEQVHDSKLATVAENLYRTPEMEERRALGTEERSPLTLVGQG